MTLKETIFMTLLTILIGTPFSLFIRLKREGISLLDRKGVLDLIKRALNE